MRGTFALVGALLLAGTFAAVLQAATFAVSVLPATVTSSAITLNGVDQKTSFSTAISVTAGSSATGWNLTAWAPLPTSGANTLGALVVTTQPTLGACSPSGSCSLAVPTGITWPVALGTTAGAAAKIYNAGVGSGNKDNVVNVTFDVSVPASALPGSYTTTLTIIGSSAGP